jgi:hypothetical protein
VPFAGVCARCKRLNMGRNRHIGTFRRAVSHVLALALLLPMLFAVLPSPVSAGDMALYRDIQRNRCLEQGLPLPDDTHACYTCVLCVAAAIPQSSLSVDPFAIFAPPVQSAQVAFVFEALSRADLAAITVPDPGRGPPA